MMPELQAHRQAAMGASYSLRWQAGFITRTCNMYSKVDRNGLVVRKARMDRIIRIYRQICNYNEIF